MKTTQNKKASWTKPEVKSLNIKKDTFAGTAGDLEQVSGQGATTKKR